MNILDFSFLEGEKPVLLLRMSWTSYMENLLRAALVLVAFVAGLKKFYPSWWENEWGVVGFVILLASSLIYLSISWWKKFLTTYIVTNNRVIDVTQERILQRAITEISLSEIEEVKIKPQSWWEKINGRGNVILKLCEKKGTLIFYNIQNPEKVLETIDKMDEEINEILEKEGKKCSVIVQNNKEQKVPLTYSYFGEKGKIQEEKKIRENVKENGELKILKKSRKNKKKKND